MIYNKIVFRVYGFEELTAADKKLGVFRWRPWRVFIVSTSEETKGKQMKGNQRLWYDENTS